MKFCNSHLTRNIFNLNMRRFFFGLVYVYNPFLVYCRELDPGTVSLTGDRAQGDDSKHDSHYTPIDTRGIFALL